MTQQHHCIKIEDEGKTWNNAREYCEKSNADLVMLDDDSEREFLRNLRQAIYHFPLILLTGEQFSYQTNNSP
jgi:DNA-binding NarL/FixJ family response regulator